MFFGSNLVVVSIMVYVVVVIISFYRFSDGRECVSLCYVFWVLLFYLGGGEMVVIFVGGCGGIYIGYYYYFGY